MAKEKKRKKLPTAEKRIIQQNIREARNKAFRSKVKTAINSAKKAVHEGKDAKAIEKKLSEAYSLLDRAVNRNIFKRNKSSRIKATLSTAIKK